MRLVAAYLGLGLWTTKCFSSIRPARAFCKIFDVAPLHQNMGPGSFSITCGDRSNSALTRVRFLNFVAPSRLSSSSQILERCCQGASQPA